MRTVVNHFMVMLAMLAGVGLALAPARAANYEFYGRAGDGVEIDFGGLPGVPAGATFSGLSLSGFSGHTVHTSSQLDQGSFSSDGRLWVFANPKRDTPALGDMDPDARGFQGRLEGSLSINGQPKTFAITIQPGYTGAGQDSVGQSSERINGAANNRLYVAQQQQRLRYFGFVKQGGGAIVVDGLFGPNTDAALRTFQGAFVGGVNTTQNSVNGIIGPNTAGWLNAANAPTWDELIDPDPQPPGTFSVSRMIGDFDILPGRDPGTGLRTGNTPQSERFGTDWSIDLWKAGSAAARSATGITQLMNAMSTDDGYGSAAAHSTHRVGMDIDMHVASSTHNFGNGSTSAAELAVINTAVAYIDAGNSGDPHRGSVLRIISSNQDILNGITARRSVSTYFDSSGVHLNHLHIDVGSPARVSGLANLSGDFNLDDAVDAADYTVWRDGLGTTRLQSELSLWRMNFGSVRTGVGSAAASLATTVPEPGSIWLALLASLVLLRLREPKAARVRLSE